MKEQKRDIAFDGYEHRIPVSYADEMRHRLMEESRHNDAIDGLILKIRDAKTKKSKLHKECALGESRSLSKWAVHTDRQEMICFPVGRCLSLPKMLYVEEKLQFIEKNREKLL